jgi:2'-5' RNA ligase
MENDLFFAFSIEAPWIHQFPKGKIIEKSLRHMTLAYLGDLDFFSHKTVLENIPKPAFSVGKTGIFTRCLFLPEREPRAIAWLVDFLENQSVVTAYHKKLFGYLIDQNLLSKNGERNSDLPHVTIARNPKSLEDWKNCFSELPFYIKSLVLYESLGNSLYKELWSYPFLCPFEELKQSADLAFIIRGETLQEIFFNAKIALAFHLPGLVCFFPILGEVVVKSLEEIIFLLNRLIAKADQKLGSPFKSVSCHGKLEKTKTGYTWALIVDKIETTNLSTSDKKPNN